MNTLAQEVAAALVAGDEFAAKGRQLLEQIGAISEARHFDIGSGGRQLIVWPGWNPLDDPRRFINLSLPG